MFHKATQFLVLIFILSSLLLSACSAQPTPAATAAPTNTALPPTETPVPPTDTPVPTDTPTITPTPTNTPLPTNTPTATPNRAATKTASANATQEALTAKIKGELQALNLPTEGKLVWMAQDDNILTVTQYGQEGYMDVADEKVFDNFVLKVEVDWESKSGIAGCGIIFRADKSIRDGEQYKFYLMRLSGAPAWDIEYWDNGEPMANLMGKVRYSNLMNILEGQTNTYYLAADKENISVYANGDRMGYTTFSRLSEGKFAWFVWQESGSTTCTYKNAWIWELP